MPNYRKILSLFFLTFLSSLLFDFLAGPPEAIDVPMHVGLWAAVGIQFALWIWGIFSWGQLALRGIRIKNAPIGISLATGSLLYALVALLLASAGLLFPEMKFFLLFVQCVGIACAQPDFSRLNRKIHFAFLPILLLFALNLLDSLVIHSYWDPLHHHLAGARLFWEAGRLYFPRNAIASYQEGGFELLFLWPHFLFGKVGGKGLLPVQIFSQLTHCFLGFGGSILVAKALAECWLPNRFWQILATTLFAIPASLRFAVPMAKNDWGIVLWVLAGFWILVTQAENRKIVLAGILWGFAWIAKLSSGFALLGMGSIFLFRKFSRRQIFYFSAAFTLGAAPLLLRNYLSTGDPLFPLLPDFFKIHEFAMGPTWREALTRYQDAPSGAKRVMELFPEFPAAALSLLAGFFTLKKNEDAGLRAAGAALIIGLGVFSFIAGAATELRLLGALLPLSAILVVALAHRISLLLPLRTTYLPNILLAALAVILPYRWEAVRRVPMIPQGNQMAEAYVSGRSQAWFRGHFRPGMKAALLVETRIYHSLPLPMIRLWDSPTIDRELRATHNPREFFRALQRQGFTHLILSTEKLDLFYPRELVAAIEVYARKYPDTFVFQAEHSLVVDVAAISLKSE